MATAISSKIKIAIITAVMISILTAGIGIGYAFYKKRIMQSPNENMNDYPTSRR